MEKGRRNLLFLIFLAASALVAAMPPAPARTRPGQDTGESRDAWQRPNDVMDALGIGPGGVVADVGCGEGYFVLRLARRVGATGTVYAEDISRKALDAVRAMVKNEQLTNVRVIEGQADDPRLPGDALDAVLVVNAYHEFREYDAMLTAIGKALKPGGRLGVIDAAGDETRSRAEHQHHHTIAEALVREDAARNRFTFRNRERGFYRPDGERHDFFFLIFVRPAP